MRVRAGFNAAFVLELATAAPGFDACSTHFTTFIRFEASLASFRDLPVLAAEFEYQASSPDELALCNFAAYMGFQVRPSLD